MTKPTPAELHAALKVIRNGLGEGIGRTRNEVLDEYRERGTSQFRTRFGTVSVTRGSDRPVIVREAAFLEWVKQNHPTEVVESVRPSFRTIFEGNLQVHGDKVTYRGEVLDFAAVRTVSDTVSVRAPTEVQQAATSMVLEHLEELTRYAIPELGARDE